MIEGCRVLHARTEACESTPFVKPCAISRVLVVVGAQAGRVPTSPQDHVKPTRLLRLFFSKLPAVQWHAAGHILTRGLKKRARWRQKVAIGTCFSWKRGQVSSPQLVPRAHGTETATDCIRNKMIMSQEEPRCFSRILFRLLPGPLPTARTRLACLPEIRLG